MKSVTLGRTWIGKEIASNESKSNDHLPLLPPYGPGPLPFGSSNAVVAVPMNITEENIQALATLAKVVATAKETQYKAVHVVIKDSVLTAYATDRYRAMQIRRVQLDDNLARHIQEALDIKVPKVHVREAAKMLDYRTWDGFKEGRGVK